MLFTMPLVHVLFSLWIFLPNQIDWIWRLILNAISKVYFWVVLKLYNIKDLFPKLSDGWMIRIMKLWLLSESVIHYYFLCIHIIIFYFISIYPPDFIAQSILQSMHNHVNFFFFSFWFEWFRNYRVDKFSIDWISYFKNESLEYFQIIVW